MYLLAPHVPSAGTVLELRILPGDKLATAIEVTGEVRWGRAVPTLDHPVPGFGIHFMEFRALASAQDELVQFLTLLGVEYSASRVQLQTGKGVALAVCAFQ